MGASKVCPATSTRINRLEMGTLLAEGVRTRVPGRGRTAVAVAAAVRTITGFTGTADGVRLRRDP
jgi:hypothetical protein